MMMSSAVIAQLCQVGIMTQPVASRSLPGGTHGPVLLLDDGICRLVVKSESPEENRVVADFLDQYRELDLLPQLRYLAPDACFLAYTYLPGNPIADLQLDRDQWFTVVDRVIARAQQSRSDSRGFVLRPYTSLTGYLLDEVTAWCGGMDDLLGNGATETVLALIHKHETYLNAQTTYRLHGDLGAHNLLISEGSVVGVIDPLVVDSLPFLEVLFLAASTPHSFGLEGVISLCQRLPSQLVPPTPVLRDCYQMTLYNRIETSRRHHPQDLKAYRRMYRELSTN